MATVSRRVGEILLGVALLALFRVSGIPTSSELNRPVRPLANSADRPPAAEKRRPGSPQLPAGKVPRSSPPPPQQRASPTTLAQPVPATKVAGPVVKAAIRATTSTTDMWALYPTVPPGDAAVDGYDWRTFYDEVALALTLLGGPGVLDPWEVERTLTGQTSLQAPSAGELTKAASLLNVKHLLVPVIAATSAGCVELRLQSVEVRPKAGGLELSDLVKVKLDTREPAGNAEALLQAIPSLVAAFGLTIPAQAIEPPVGLYWTEPPLPFSLVDDIQAAARQLATGGFSARELLRLAQFHCLLGQHLSRGSLPQGPRLLVRGSALASLASLSARGSGEALLVRGFAELLSRHTARAKQLLSGLTKSGDEEAVKLVRACSGDWEKLARAPMDRFLQLVAMERAQRPPDAQQRKRFKDGRFPIAFLMAGTARHFEIPYAIYEAFDWLFTNENQGCETSDTPRYKAQANQDMATTGAGLLQERASRLSLRPGPVSAAREPVTPTLRPMQVYVLRSELLALPGVEFAVSTMTGWGNPWQTQKVLEAARAALPLAESVPNAMATLKPYDRSGMFDAWPSRPTISDPADPFLTLPFISVRGRSASGGNPAGRLELDLGSTNVGLVDKRLASLQGDGGERDVLAATLEFELKVDPWDVLLWTKQLAMTGAEKGLAEVQKQSRLAEALLPDADEIPCMVARVLMARACIGSATKGLRSVADRFPQSSLPLSLLFESYLTGNLLGRAGETVREMKRKGLDSLLVTGTACQVAERLLDLGRKEQARSMLEVGRFARTGKQDAEQATARFLILDGKVAEGLQLFDTSAKHYPDRGVSGWRPVKALLEAGLVEEGVRQAAASDSFALASSDYLERLAEVFGLFGHTTHAETYLRRAAALRGAAAAANTSELQAARRIVASLTTTRDPKLLARWMALAEREGGLALVHATAMNPYPEATAALLQLVTSPVVGSLCATMLAYRAQADLDLPASPTSDDLKRAHRLLEAWWSKTKDRSLETVFE